jgi:preprotein translocase subunit SecG
MMETALLCLVVVALVVAAFVMLTRAFSDPPDQSHPD